MSDQQLTIKETHETVDDAIMHLPEKLHMPKFIGTLTNLILIGLIIAGGVGFVIYQIDKKVNAMVSTNKVIQEYALKSSEQTVLLRVVDEKLGAKVTIQDKVKVAQTIYSLATIKKIPLNLICGLIEVESNWNPDCTSEANAKGLMQPLPSTARPYLRCERIEYSPNVLFDPVVNVTVGIEVLADLHAAHVEAGQETVDTWDKTLHSYFWGATNTAQLYGKTDNRVNVPNMSYPMRVMTKAKFYKEKGL